MKTARERDRLAGAADRAAAARVVAVLAVAMVALAVAAGCSTAADGPIPPVVQTATSSATPTASTTPTVAVIESPAPLANLKIKLTPRWRGFAAPLYLTHAGDGSGRLFVVEQGGEIRVIRDGKLVPKAFLNVRGLISAGGERGLLGLAFAPDYARSGNLYIDYTDRNGNTVVARYTAKDPTSDAPSWDTPVTVLGVKQPYSNHNGGSLQFGPDGALFVGMGDGGSAGDPQGHAQCAGDRLGKLLRIDVSGDSFTPQIYASGLRNPWRFTFDPRSGALWIGDVGQGEWEEIDYVAKPVAGLNFGWNRWEGTHPFPQGSRASARTGFTFPVHEYPHPTGESVTGGYVYRGQGSPALDGTYLYADFVKGWIGGIKVEAAHGGRLAKPETATLLQTDMRPSSFGIDEDGELYLVDYRGTIYAVSGSPK